MAALALQVLNEHCGAVGLNHRCSVRQYFAIDFLLVAYRSIVIVTILYTSANLTPLSVYPESFTTLYKLLEDFVLSR